MVAVMAMTMGGTLAATAGEENLQPDAGEQKSLTPGAVLKDLMDGDTEFGAVEERLAEIR